MSRSDDYGGRTDSRGSGRDTKVTTIGVVHGNVISIQASAHEPAFQDAPTGTPTEVESGGLHAPHPHALQEYFTGRVIEQSQLTDWFSSETNAVMVLSAIGGMGKTALAWVWLHTRILPVMSTARHPSIGPGLSEPKSNNVNKAQAPELVIWWSFYEPDADYGRFINYVLRIIGHKDRLTNDPHTAGDQLDFLIRILNTRRILLILDGFERELRAYSTLDATFADDPHISTNARDGRRCSDPRVATLLRRLAATVWKSKILITTRLPPLELDEVTNCKLYELTSLSERDAVTFFRRKRIKGTRSQIALACAQYGFHPLALRLLAGKICHDPEQPGDIAAAPHHDPTEDLTQRRHHILRVAYESLDGLGRSVLGSIAAFRAIVQFEGLRASQTGVAEKDLRRATADLIDRGLLMFDAIRIGYDLHPIVRKYAYDRLTDPAGTHSVLRNYFSAIPKARDEDINRLDDLQPVIELYHHTVRAGLFEEGYRLFTDRLAQPLYYRFSANVRRVQLLLALFPDGDSAPPRLRSSGDWAWVYNALGNSYSCIGEPMLAISMYRSALGLARVRQKPHNAAVCLSNMAQEELRMGDLESAAQNLMSALSSMPRGRFIRHRIELWAELSIVHSFAGQYERANRDLQDARDLLDEAGLKEFSNILNAALAQRDLLRGRLPTAQAAARAALRSSTDGPSDHNRIYAAHLWCAAEVAYLDAALGPSDGQVLTPVPNTDGELFQDRIVAVEDMLQRTLADAAHLHLVFFEAHLQYTSALLNFVLGRFDEASVNVVECLAIADRCSYRLLELDAHCLLGRIALVQGKTESAREHLEFALELSQLSPVFRYQARFLAASKLLRGLTDRRDEPSGDVQSRSKMVVRRSAHGY